MNTDHVTGHLTTRETDEYLLGDRTPQMMRHLADCSECRNTVVQMEQAIDLFRSAATEYSAQTLATRPTRGFGDVSRRRPLAVPFAWALAAALPVLLLVLMFLPMRINAPKTVNPVASISDEALLDQVDEQLSVTVPSSMESLTHLVSAEGADANASGPAGAQTGRRALVESN